MKTSTLQLGILFLVFTLFYACKPTNPSNDEPKKVSFPYSLEVQATELANAPALQSFAHGVHEDNWLLFAGRTNQIDGNGGLHNMNADYAHQSFPAPSYNENIFVYNVAKDSVAKLSLTEMMQAVKTKFPKNYKAMQGNIAVFRNTNPLVKQSGEYLYVIGGYGPMDFKNPKKGYETYNHVAKIHIESMINLVYGKYDKVKADELFAIGFNDTLRNTGGEMMLSTGAFGNNMNVVVGQKFTGTPTGTQKYSDAVYPFSATPDKNDPHTLNVQVSTGISDVLDPTATSADNLSNFRRRDGPILPALFKNPTNGAIQQGINICTGVFKPGNVNQAWNDAIYVHPEWANGEGRLYTEDKEYNQNNYNVYSCPNFVVYDEGSDTTHSFLMGGIGDGKYDPKGNLSGFTNTGVHVQMNIGEFPYKSIHELIPAKNLFAQKEKNQEPFYGAEAIFFANESLSKVVVNKTKTSPGTETEVFDMSQFKEGDVFVGYIFGGIESFESNPESYGPRKSRASNKVWKVILKKK